MTVIDKIKESVERATGLQFFYDTPQTLNTRLDDMPLPCAMMQIVESGAAISENGVIRERLNVLVLFADKSELDFDGVQNERTRLDGLKKQAFAWLQALMRSETLQVVRIGNTARYYASDDAIVTAFAVNVELEEIEGVCGNGREYGHTGCGC